MIIMINTSYGKIEFDGYFFIKKNNEKTEIKIEMNSSYEKMNEILEIVTKPDIELYSIYVSNNLVFRNKNNYVNISSNISNVGDLTSHIPKEKNDNLKLNINIDIVTPS